MSKNRFDRALPSSGAAGFIELRRSLEDKGLPVPKTCCRSASVGKKLPSDVLANLIRRVGVDLADNSYEGRDGLFELEVRVRFS